MLQVDLFEITFRQKPYMRTKLLLLAFTFLSFQGFSQDEEQNGDFEKAHFAMYFKAGLNSSNFVNWDDKVPTQTLTGGSGGVGFYIQTGKDKWKTSALALEG